MGAAFRWAQPTLRMWFPRERAHHPCRGRACPCPAPVSPRTDTSRRSVGVSFAVDQIGDSDTSCPKNRQQ